MPTSPPPILLRGRVLRAATNQPVQGARVRAFDFDVGRPHQLLGEASTDAGGFFDLAADPGKGGGRQEGALEVFIVVHSDRGLLAHQSPWEHLQPGDEKDYSDIKVHPHVLEPEANPTGGERAGGPGVSPDKQPQPKDPSVPAVPRPLHGNKSRDFVAPRSPFYHGPFGRLFRELPAWVPPGGNDTEKEENIRRIADTMLEPAGESGWGDDRDNPAIPAAYTYFGQFVDHDITFDPTSSLQRLNDPERLLNFRTPRFDLDNLYGEGPDDEPFLYDQQARDGRFLIGMGASGREDDLPRNAQDVALIGDPRNDENIIVAQLQLAFLKLHNRVLERVHAEEQRSGRDAFHRAQNIVRWHYQWVVLFDYLPRICGPEVAQEVICCTDGEPPRLNLRFYKWKNAPYMPVEFSVAAYRFGHSQIRPSYDLNSVVTGVPIFLPPTSMPGPLDDLRGGRILPGSWTVDWRRFLELGGEAPQATRKIDAQLSRALSLIPAGPTPQQGASLPHLNLLRGYRMGLPSGQAVARAMGEPSFSNEALEVDSRVSGPEAPLWYYILKEAELSCGGRHLGRVGARIVAEVFAGLAKGDPNSFLNVDPTWTPQKGLGGQPLVELAERPFELRDLLRIAGVDGMPL